MSATNENEKNDMETLIDHVFEENLRFPLDALRNDLVNATEDKLIRFLYAGLDPEQRATTYWGPVSAAQNVIVPEELSSHWASGIYHLHDSLVFLNNRQDELQREGGILEDVTNVLKAVTDEYDPDNENDQIAAMIRMDSEEATELRRKLACRMLRFLGGVRFSTTSKLLKYLNENSDTRFETFNHLSELSVFLSTTCKAAPSKEILGWIIEYLLFGQVRYTLYKVSPFGYDMGALVIFHGVPEKTKVNHWCYECSTDDQKILLMDILRDNVESAYIQAFLLKLTESFFKDKNFKESLQQRIRWLIPYDYDTDTRDAKLSITISDVSDNKENQIGKVLLNGEILVTALEPNNTLLTNSDYPRRRFLAHIWDKLLEDDPRFTKEFQIVKMGIENKLNLIESTGQRLLGNGSDIGQLAVMLVDARSYVKIFTSSDQIEKYKRFAVNLPDDGSLGGEHVEKMIGDGSGGDLFKVLLIKLEEALGKMRSELKM